MGLSSFLRKIVKSACPSDCVFKEVGLNIALIPPPKEVLGVIISRDPTIRWLKFYKYVMDEIENNDIQRNILFASAIPYMLFKRITDFMDKKIRDDERNLFQLIFHKCYWTHLHKCFTDKSSGRFQFKMKYAKKCANKWLREELKIAIEDGAKFAIALGNDVQNWLKNQKIREKFEVINLPHPSGLNCKWSNTQDETIIGAICKLLKQCRSHVT